MKGVAPEDVTDQAETRAEGAEIPLRELLALPGMQALSVEVAAAARGDGAVLILGETGTGKTLFARAIAEARGRRPIVRATLGAGDDARAVTSELFGHERGAFIGALGRRTGLVEHAHGGTLVLDDVLGLSAHAQQLLLDFTQFGSYRPLGYGGPDPKHADVRVIAATNGDLEQAIAQGRFRRDLYYRLAEHVLRLPPLRERREDIPVLAEHILGRLDPTRRWSLSPPLGRALARAPHPWAGNVRELTSVLRRALARATVEDPRSETRLRVHHVLDVDLCRTDDGAAPPVPVMSGFGFRPETVDADWTKLAADRIRIEEAERRVVRAALAAEDGVVSRAARRLGLPRTTLVSRLQQLGIGIEGRPGGDRGR